MPCFLPPFDSGSNNSNNNSNNNDFNASGNEFEHVPLSDDETMIRLLGYEGCNVSLDYETRTCLLMLSREKDLLDREPLPCIFFDEKGLTRLIYHLRIMLSKLRQLPVTPPVTTDTIITLFNPHPDLKSPHDPYPPYEI